MGSKWHTGFGFVQLRLGSVWLQCLNVNSFILWQDHAMPFLLRNWSVSTLTESLNGRETPNIGVSIDGSQFLPQHQQKTPQHLHTPLTTMAFNQNLSKRPSVQSAGPDLIPKTSVISASRNKNRRAMSVTAAGDTPDLHKGQSRPTDNLNQNHREAAVKLQRLR